MTGSWRERAHRIIDEVIAANPTVTDEKELRKLISEAYPWYPRANHPYAAWLKAVKETFAQPKQHSVPVQVQRSPSAADYADTPLFTEVSA